MDRLATTIQYLPSVSSWAGAIDQVNLSELGGEYGSTWMDDNRELKDEDLGELPSYFSQTTTESSFEVLGLGFKVRNTSGF